MERRSLQRPFVFKYDLFAYGHAEALPSKKITFIFNDKRNKFWI